MANIFDLMDPSRQTNGARADNDLVTMLHKALAAGEAEVTGIARSGDIQSTAALAHVRRMMDEHATRGRASLADAQSLLDGLRAVQAEGKLGASWADYLRDAGERMVLTADTLRKRGDIFLEHEAAGCPPVLIYDYEVIVDGKDLPYPCNYMLLKITPPEGVAIDDTRRPYVIVDPRAGHGPGIGGFKADSQVGVALRAGHPVYFVSFRRDPEPGQYLAYVTRAEAEFVRTVMRRHPKAPKPVITGNCQGGWATLLLAATNPDLTGPIVINGAPVATWAGEVGTNPMRYNAGVLGGTWVPMMLSDLGGGTFDGANLVMNFELLNPGRTLFRKYTDLYRDIDKGDARFLEFEKWWGGFFLMSEAEIRWIVEQLFVGNRLVKNEARIEPGRPVDLKAIRAPIIVFASHGDNITPPQQALNWIAETYSDVSEIKIRGQRIIYMVHDQIGHLGIFVSASIATREHSEVGTTLETIEALAPGLYEMVIEDYTGPVEDRKFTVGFVERTLDDLRKLDDGVDDEAPFAAVARASEIQAQAYDMVVRPAVKAMVTDTAAELGRAMHPNRLVRALASSRNPLVAPVEDMAAKVKARRQPADAENPFLKAEALWVQMTEQAIDLMRDQRDMMYELTFHALWGNPWMRMFGRTHEARRTLKSDSELRNLPEVSAALMNIDRGGFVEAVIRMLILLADNRGTVRRDRLERSNRVLTEDEPFRSLTPERRAKVIHEQTLIATYEPERAIETLPLLLHTRDERELAARLVQYIPGEISEMTPRTLSLLQRFREVLGLPALTDDVLEDPLASPGPDAASTPPSVASPPPVATALSAILPDPLPPEPVPPAPRRTAAARVSAEKSAVVRRSRAVKAASEPTAGSAGPAPSED
jgi:pimeloyl-ACP methyl ester carboxylesterase